MARFCNYFIIVVLLLKQIIQVHLFHTVCRTLLIYNLVKQYHYMVNASQVFMFAIQEILCSQNTLHQSRFNLKLLNYCCQNFGQARNIMQDICFKVLWILLSEIPQCIYYWTCQITFVYRFSLATGLNWWHTIFQVLFFFHLILL